MEITVINGTYRPEGTTTALSRSFMEGVKAGGADAEMIMLRDHTIGMCTNCLKCYAFTGDGIAPCCMKDDMDAIIGRLAEADGILFASPVHNGFVTGLMTLFWERLSWRIMRPGGPIAGCGSLHSRITGKIRACASIVSAGGMPTGLGKKACNDGTPWLKSNAPLAFHGQWIGEMYAGADLERLPGNRRDWERLYFLRKLSERQHREARDLGDKMVRAIQSGRLRPSTMEKMIPAIVRMALKPIVSIFPMYKVAP